MRQQWKVLLTWDDKVSKSLCKPGSRSTYEVNTTGWLKGLQVVNGGGPFHGLGEVVQQVAPVGHLDSRRRAAGGGRRAAP